MVCCLVVLRSTLVLTPAKLVGKKAIKTNEIIIENYWVSVGKAQWDPSKGFETDYRGTFYLIWKQQAIL